MTDILDKSLPSNDDAENLCLGTILLQNEYIDTCIPIFGPEDLYNLFNRHVYKAMIVANEEGQAINPVNILEYFKRANVPEAMHSVTQITNLAYGIPYVVEAEIIQAATAIKTHSISRQAIKLASHVARDLISGDMDPREVIAKLEQRAIHLSNRLDSDRRDGPVGFARVIDIIPTVEGQFESYHRGESTGVRTGMHELDHTLDGGGLQKKATYVVGGREKSGKTSLALDWCENISTKQEKASLIVTLEMSKETLIKRLYSKYTGIPYYMFRPGFYDTNLDNPYTRAMQGLAEFGKFPFLIADSLYTMDEIYRHCAKQVELGQKEGNTEVGVIVLDYLQIIGVPDPRMPTTERVSRVSRDIKIMASDLDVPVIVMSNLNRVGMSEEGREPDVDNLRDSGSIAFDAEAVMFVHNPAYIPGKPYQQKDVTDYTLILNRQRNGPTGRFALKLIGPYMQFMTEADYNKSHKINDVGIPLSKGQMLLKENTALDIWDDKDENDEDDEY